MTHSDNQIDILGWEEEKGKQRGREIEKKV